MAAAVSASTRRVVGIGVLAAGGILAYQWWRQRSATSSPGGAIVPPRSYSGGYSPPAGYSGSGSYAPYTNYASSGQTASNYAGGSYYQAPQYQSGSGSYYQPPAYQGTSSSGYSPYTNYASGQTGTNYAGGTYYQPPQYQSSGYGGGYTPPSYGGYSYQGGGSVSPPSGPLQPSQQLLNFVVGQEGFNPNPYADGAQTSIGFGTRYTGQVTPPISRATGMQLLQQELEAAASYVNKAVTVALSQNQFDALVDFEYNTGAIGKIAGFLNAGNLQAMFEKLNEYIHQGGRVLQDLVKRRAAEVQMFTNGVY